MIGKSDYDRSQVLLAPGKVSEEPVSSSGRLSLASNSVIRMVIRSGYGVMIRVRSYLSAMRTLTLSISAWLVSTSSSLTSPHRPP